MILEVALPHENITWVATKVNTENTVPETAVAAPKKGKVVTNAELKTTLLGVVKQWGQYGRGYLKAFML